jgi:hypothetical protein
VIIQMDGTFFVIFVLFRFFFTFDFSLHCLAEGHIVFMLFKLIGATLTS